MKNDSNLEQMLTLFNSMYAQEGEGEDVFVPGLRKRLGEKDEKLLREREEIIASHDQARYDVWKKTLPCHSIFGTLDQPSANEKLKKPSPIIGIETDGIPAPYVRKLMEDLYADPNLKVVCVYPSASGEGLHLLITHRLLWELWLSGETDERKWEQAVKAVLVAAKLHMEAEYLLPLREDCEARGEVVFFHKMKEGEKLVDVDTNCWNNGRVFFYCPGNGKVLFREPEEALAELEDLFLVMEDDEQEAIRTHGIYVINEKDTEREKKFEKNLVRLEALTQRVEEKKVDIAEKYGPYRDMIYAIVNSCGEKGRSCAKRLCMLHENPDMADVDRIYDAALKGANGGNSLGTVFWLAKQAGVDVSDITQSIRVLDRVQFTNDYQQDVSHLTPLHVSAYKGWSNTESRILATCTTENQKDIAWHCTFSAIGPLFHRKLKTFWGNKLRNALTSGLTIGPSTISDKHILLDVIELCRPRQNAVEQAHAISYQEWLEKMPPKKDEKARALWEKEEPILSNFLYNLNTTGAALINSCAINGEKLLYSSEFDIFTSSMAGEWGKGMDAILRQGMAQEMFGSERKGVSLKVDPAFALLASLTPEGCPSFFRYGASGTFPRFTYLCTNGTNEVENRGVHSGHTTDNVAIIRAIGEEWEEFINRYVVPNGPFLFWPTEDQEYYFCEMVQANIDEAMYAGRDTLAAWALRQGIGTLDRMMLEAVMKDKDKEEDSIIRNAKPRPINPQNIRESNKITLDDDTFEEMMDKYNIYFEYASNTWKYLPADKPAPRGNLSIISSPNKKGKVSKYLPIFEDMIINGFDRCDYLAACMREGLNAGTASNFLGKMVAEGKCVSDGNGHYTKTYM